MVGLILVPGDRLVVPFSAALAARRFEQEVRVPAELQRSDPQPHWVKTEGCARCTAIMCAMMGMGASMPPEDDVRANLASDHRENARLRGEHPNPFATWPWAVESFRSARAL
jgi:hypothetical protein